MTTIPPRSHHLLRIDSSARAQGSHSRELGDCFESAWRKRFSGATVSRRDVASQTVGHIENMTITGMFTPTELHNAEMSASLVQSDSMIAELKAADAILVTVPMYNFGIPSSLKAWIDQITRIGQTFSFDGTNFTGLLHGKKAYIVIAYGAGGYSAGDKLASANFVEPYLKFLFGFLGFDTVMIYNSEATNTNPAGIRTTDAVIAAQMNADLGTEVL
jgi:FMN-dependent NADH-azoreductase